MSRPKHLPAPESAPKPVETSGFETAQPHKRTETAQEPSVRKRLAEMPNSARRGYLRAVAGNASPRAAIKAFCLECCGWDRDGVRLCTAPACPLYSYRPFQEGQS